MRLKKRKVLVSEQFYPVPGPSQVLDTALNPPTSLRTRDSTHRLGQGGPGRRAAFRGEKAGLEPQVLESSLLACGQLSALSADGSTDVLRWEDEKIQLLMMIAAQLWGPLLAPGAVLHADLTESS